MTATMIPDFLFKAEKDGTEVLYKDKPVRILGHYHTCPCAIGMTDHHPSDDILMIELDGIGNVQFSVGDFEPLPEKKT